MQDPRSYYDEVAAKSRLAVQESERRERRIALSRLTTAVLGLVALYVAFKSGHWYGWMPVLAAVLIFVTLVKAALRQEMLTRHHRGRLNIATHELEALSGNHNAFYDGGAYLDVAHPYSFDLDIFGPRSVFQMLSRTVTLEGTALLAARMQDPDIRPESITARQAGIRELAAMPDLMREFRVTGSLATEATGELQQVREWLESDDEFRNSRLTRLAAYVMPVLAAAGVALSIWEERMHPALNLIIAVNGLLWGLRLKRIKHNNRVLGRNAAVISKYAGLLGHIAGADFQTPLLRDMSAGARTGLQELQQFNRLVGRFDSRNNGMAGPLMNVLFLHDFRSLLQLEDWRYRNRGRMQATLADLAAFDLLNALGSYAFNHPGHNYPDLDAAHNSLIAEDLRHPLLPGDTAVGNSFTLGREEQLYLLTGANMTGKSTFIRTVGVSMILGYLGIPLPAKSLTLPLLRLFTSIRVTDSVQEDVSYFKAELQRIRSLFETVSAARGTYLVLIDEPLRGTNSGDKQEGTAAIIERLLGEGVTGIVATHDTGLCRLEAASGARVRNYHFESLIENGTLRFDFRLKTGCSRSANASLLMRQMGIIRGAE